MNPDIYNWDAENQRILPSQQGIYRRADPPRHLYYIIGFLCFLSLGIIALALWMYIRYIA